MSKTRFHCILWLCASLSIIVLLVGCGGGGGGSNNPSGSAEELGVVNVSGRILDSNADPIPYAIVTIMSDPVVVTANKWGEFVAKVAPGDHVLTVSKDNSLLFQKAFTATEGLVAYLGDLSPKTPYNAGGASAQTMNVTGTWVMRDTVVQDSCAPAGKVDIYNFSISQNGTQLTLTNITSGGSINGTISGDIITASGPVQGSTDNASISLTMAVSQDGVSMSGTYSWAHKEGSTSCSGERQIAGAKFTLVPISSTAGAVTGTVTYTGSHGPVSAGKPIIVQISPFPDTFDALDNGSTSQVARLTSSPGTFTFTNLPAAQYHLVVMLDISNDGATEGDPCEIYTPGSEAGSNYHLDPTTAFTVTAGQLYSMLPNITFDDTMWVGQ